MKERMLTNKSPTKFLVLYHSHFISEPQSENVKFTKDKRIYIINKVLHKRFLKCFFRKVIQLTCRCYFKNKNQTKSPKNGVLPKQVLITEKSVQSGVNKLSLYLNVVEFFVALLNNSLITYLQNDLVFTVHFI